MSILTWNVRGLNLEARRKDVKEHITKHKPSFVALLETKIKVNKMIRLIRCIPASWMHKTNHEHSIGGRICLA